MNENKQASPLSDKDKQACIMPNEADPKSLRTGVFLAMQKARAILSRTNRSGRGGA